MSDRDTLIQIIDENDGCAIADPKTIEYLADVIIAAGFTSVPEVAKWVAYADKLEVALKLATGGHDYLMRTHAEQGLRVVRPA